MESQLEFHVDFAIFFLPFQDCPGCSLGGRERVECGDSFVAVSEMQTFWLWRGYSVKPIEGGGLLALSGVCRISYNVRGIFFAGIVHGGNRCCLHVASVQVMSLSAICTVSQALLSMCTSANLWRLSWLPML